MRVFVFSERRVHYGSIVATSVCDFFSRDQRSKVSPPSYQQMLEADLIRLNID
jgi:hypothetical protein